MESTAMVLPDGFQRHRAHALEILTSLGLLGT